MAGTSTITNNQVMDQLDKLAERTEQGFQTINQNLQDFMQMTSHRFDMVDERLDRLETRMDALEERMDMLESRVKQQEGQIQELGQASYRHQLQLRKLTATVEATNQELHTLIHSDVKEILDRITALEKASTSRTEVRELKHKLETVIKWALQVAQKEGIALEIK